MSLASTDPTRAAGPPPVERGYGQPPIPTSRVAAERPPGRPSSTEPQERVPQDTAPGGSVPARGRTTEPRVSVVIPTFNEAKNLPVVLARVPRDVHEVIIADGYSMDDTVDVARSLRPDVKIVLQNRMGKGNAVACGCAAATGDIVVTLEPDGSTDPGEIPRFVAALLAGADVAKGSRFADGGGSDISPLRVWGNRWINRLANGLFRARYTDVCYGYNAFWRDCVDRLRLDPGPDDPTSRLWGDGLEIETLINARAAKARLNIIEVPSLEHAGVHGRANPRTWRDGARILRVLLVERFNRLPPAPAAAPANRLMTAAAVESAAPVRGGDRNPF